MINKYPYTENNYFNLDWIISKIKELNIKMDDFIITNKITYGGEWDISKGYPASTIVVYNDSGYIAIKPVPVGVDINNTDYWVKVANFTEEIADLGNRVVQLEDEVDDLTNDVNALGTIRALKPGKNIVFYGDSWTVGTGASDSSLRFSTKCANALELNEINLGVGGSGFTRPDNLIKTQINADNLTPTQIAETNYVVICAGVNDIRHYADTTASALANAVIECAQLASEKFPDAVIIMAIMTTERNGIADTHKYWMGYAIDRLMYANIERVVVCDMRYILYNRVNAYISDNFHPNNFGHGLVAGQIVNTILGSKSECYHYIETGLVFDSTVANAPSGGHIFFNNGILNVTEGRLNFVNPITSTTIVGSVNASVVPTDNVYTPFYYGNSAVGTFAITSNGNVYIIPNDGQSLTTGFIQPFSYTA